MRLFTLACQVIKQVATELFTTQSIKEKYQRIPALKNGQSKTFGISTPYIYDKWYGVLQLKLCKYNILN